MTPQNPLAPNAKPKKSRWTWKRRTKLTLWILAGAALLFRLSLIFLLPMAMRRAAAHYGLQCNYNRIELSLLGGDANVWGLSLKLPGGGDALIKTDYARAKIHPWKLLIGKLDVERLEADGADLLVEREADGKMPLLEALLKSASTTAASTGKPIDLSAPLRVDATRITHLRAHFRDAHVSPIFETTVALELRITDMGHPVHPTTFEATLTADKLVDVLRIDGDVKSAGRTLDAHVNVLMRGLKLKPVAAYLAPWGLRPNADDISLRLKSHITTAPVPDPALGVRGTLTLEQVAYTVDGIEQIGLDKLTLQADSIDSKLANFSHLLIDGARARFGRSSDGYLRAGGIDFLKPPAAAPATTTPAAPSVASGLRFALSEFSLKNVQAAFHDEAVSPPADLSLEFDSIDAKNRAAAAAGTDGVIDVTAVGRAPGVAGNLSAQGTLTPLGPKKILTVKLAADKIKPDALKPYLDLLGVESTLAAGQFTTSLRTSVAFNNDNSITADADLADTRLTDSGAELFAFKDVRLAGIGFDPATDRIRAAAIDMKGPNLTASREVSGAFAALGLRTKSVPRPPAAAKNPHPGNLSLPRIEIGHFSWTDIHLALTDSTVTPATKIALTDAGLEMNVLLLDLDAPSQAGKTGTLKIWASAPGLIERLSIDGNLTPRAHSLDTDLKISGTHMNLAVLAPYLKNFNIEPTLHDGDFQCEFNGSATKSARGVSASLAITNARLADGKTELASVKAARIGVLDATSAAVEMGDIGIFSPKVSISRDPSGSLAACGIRILPPAAAESAPHIAPAAPAEKLTIRKLAVTDAQVDWQDLVPKLPVKTALTGNVEITDLAPNAGHISHLHLTGQIVGAIDNVAVTGTFNLDPKNTQTDLDIRAAGVRAGSLAGYVPRGVTVNFNHAVLATHLTAALKKLPAGGQGASLKLLGLELVDDNHVLLSLKSAALEISRLDLDNRLVDIASVSSAGVETYIHRDKSGTIEIAGLRFDGAVPDPVAKTYQQISLGGPPLVKINQIILLANRLDYTDDSLPAPITLRDVTFVGTEPIECLGRDAATLAPAKFRLTTALDPIAKQFTADISLAPFAAEPLVSIDIAAAGLSGPGLASIVPILNRYGEVGTLTDGTLHMDAGVLLKLDRRSPLDFNLSRPFQATAWLKDVAFRATAAGPIVAGVKDIKADGIQIEPAAKLATIKSLEITEPIGRLALSDEGILAMGMIFKLPQTPTPSANSAAVKMPAASIEAPSAPPPAPWELRITKLLLSGIDAQLTDTRVTPPFVIPLNSLELEASNLTSKALIEPREIRFSLLANSGKVALANAAAAPEERDLFSQTVGSGKIAIYPKPKGWIKLALTGMELEALRAEAARQGVNLSSGQFDATVDARFHGDGTGRIEMRLVVTDLRLSEPAGGPIQSFLKVPTPLNAVIQLMEDPDGSITVPLNFSLANNQLSPGTISAAIPGAIAHVMMTAIASAPLKLLGAGSKKAEKLTPLSITFAPGVAVLDASAVAQLQSLISRMKIDKHITVTLTHELGAGDVTREAERSSPALPEARSMIAQLRQRKLQLAVLRAELTGRATGEIASSAAGGAAETLSLLKSIDRELAQTDDALDAVGDLLKPGAEKQAPRRTRAAALVLSKERLSAIRNFLLQSQIPGMKDRIQVAVPAFKPTANAAGGTVVLSPVRTR